MRKNNVPVKGENYRFYPTSCFHMPESEDKSIALTITSPTYWNARVELL